EGLEGPLLPHHRPAPRHLRRPAGEDRLGLLRPRQRPALRALHGALRLRAVGGAGRQRPAGRQPQDAAVAAVLSPVSAPALSLIFARRREAMFFRRLCRPRERLAGAPCPAWRTGPPGRGVVLLETGVGGAAMGAALEWLLGGPLRPAAV